MFDWDFRAVSFSPEAEIKTILEKWIQLVFVFGSILSFAGCKITGAWMKYQLPLNHQCKKYQNMWNHCKRDFISDFNKWVFIKYFFFWKKVTYVCTFSNLSVTSNPPISKAYMCGGSVFLAISNLPFSKTRVAHKGHMGMLSMVLGLPGARVISLFWFRKTQVFPKG